jgi:hypothetical protein
MKKIFLFCFLFALISGAIFAQVKSGSTVWISSKTAELKASASAFASVKGSLKMAEQVKVLQVKGNWAEVQSVTNPALTGWTVDSNLSTRRIVASGSSADAKEVALAGQGFDQEVENEYKTQGKYNYEDVDKTEAIVVSMDELHKFITEGRLSTGE